MSRGVASFRARKILAVLDSIAMLISLCITKSLFNGKLTLPEYIPVLIYMIVSVIFLAAFELYEIVPLTLKETLISIVLSGFYSSVILILSNALLCLTKAKATMPAIAIFQYCSTSTLLQLAIHFSSVLYAENRKNKPKLLFIDEIGGDYLRLKRLRYATTKAFDSRYEQINMSNREESDYALNILLPQFDSVCLLENISGGLQKEFIRKAMDLKIELYVVPMLVDVAFSHLRFTYFDDVLSYHMRPYQLTRIQAILKRATDIIAATVLLLTMLLPMLLIAAAVKITSRGSCFYTQERYTAGKKLFSIYKFRTMVQDAEKLTGPVFAVKADPRVTRVGAFLRRTRLDELPQLFNILFGHMSLVGPRPERPHFVEQYEKEIDNYSHRFAVKAGLTALSHVHGKYSTDIEDRTRYDLIYISNYSWMLDMRILLQTSRIIFLPDTAEGVDNGAYPKRLSSEAGGKHIDNKNNSKAGVEERRTI